MKKITLHVLMIITLISITMAAHAGDFKNVVVFGDSLSDNGNFHAGTGFMPPPPYYQGRFSDGPVWVEHLIESLGIKGLFLNYAYGGAQTGETNVNGDFPGFLSQTAAYVDMLPTSQRYPSAFAMPEDSLFIIWIGANDFLGDLTDPVTAINQAVANIQAGVTELMQAGATNFFIINLPDLGKTPRFNKDSALSSQATQLAMAFNQALEQLLAEIETTNPAIEINRMDSFALLGGVIDLFETYGFTNAEDAKFDIEQGTVNEGTYIFWDSVHPTTKTHKLLSQKAMEIIICDSCLGKRLPYFENGFTLTVPYAELENNAYGFKLVPYENIYDDGLYWMLDLTSLTVQ